VSAEQLKDDPYWDYLAESISELEGLGWSGRLNPQIVKRVLRTMFGFGELTVWDLRDADPDGFDEAREIAGYPPLTDRDQPSVAET